VERNQAFERAKEALKSDRLPFETQEEKDAGSSVNEEREGQYIQASGQRMLAGLLLVLAWQLAFLALLLFYNYTVTNKI